MDAGPAAYADFVVDKYKPIFSLKGSPGWAGFDTRRVFTVVTLLRYKRYIPIPLTCLSTQVLKALIGTLFSAAQAATQAIQP